MNVTEWVAIVALVLSVCSLYVAVRANRISAKAHKESGRLVTAGIARVGDLVIARVTNRGRLPAYITSAKLGWGFNGKPALRSVELVDSGKTIELLPGRTVALESSGDPYCDLVLRVVTEEGDVAWLMSDGEARNWRDRVRRNIAASRGTTTWMGLD